MKDDVARLVEPPSLRSARLSTQKNMRSRVEYLWVKKRKAQGKGPRLNALDDRDND